MIKRDSEKWRAKWREENIQERTYFTTAQGRLCFFTAEQAQKDLCRVLLVFTLLYGWRAKTCTHLTCDWMARCAPLWSMLAAITDPVWVKSACKCECVHRGGRFESLAYLPRSESVPAGSCRAATDKRIPPVIAKKKSGERILLENVETHFKDLIFPPFSTWKPTARSPSSSAKSQERAEWMSSKFPSDNDIIGES